jgi:hypothetical protein
MALDPALVQTLQATAAALAQARDPWWIFASAAVALHGAPDAAVADVDVLVGEADAQRIFAALGLEPVADGGTAKFRSALLGRWRSQPMPVEFMARFEVHTEEGWSPVVFATREPVSLGGHTLFVPAREELVRTLLTFGRPKDLERARRLAQG